MPTTHTSLTMRRLLIPSFLLIIILSGVVSAASLSQKQVRKLISRLAGAQLSSDAIRVKKITETGSNAEATVEIETAFRLVQDKQGRWRVDEMRTGQDQWEEIALIAEAASSRLPDSGCKAAEFSAAKDNSNLSARH